MADPYSLLGIAKNADEKAIKSAYRKLAKELHPDRNKDNPAATEKFAQVTQAYDLLSDPQKRAAYDRGEIDAEGNPRGPFGGGFNGGFGGRPGGAQAGGFDFGGGVDLGDIFDGLFGGGGARGGFQGVPPRSAPPKGANIAYDHLVSFTDAATLVPQRITLSDGKMVEFKLPKGVVAGQQIRIPGKGQPGPGGNGDAMVTLKIGRHPHFDREGDNIRLSLPISVKEAIDGAKVKVPTVDGPVMLSVPAGANSGTTLRIKGRGFTTKSGDRGDQLVTLMIHLPTDRDLQKKIADCIDEDENVRGAYGK